MILKEQVELAKVIASRMENLYEHLKDPMDDPLGFKARTELSSIILDVQELNAILMQTWRYSK